MTYLSRTTFLCISVLLMWSSSVFAGTLTNISHDSTSYIAGETADYTISYTVETANPNMIVRVLFPTGFDLSAIENDITKVSITVDGNPAPIATGGWSWAMGDEISIRLVNSNLVQAGSDIIITVEDVVNAGVGVHAWGWFATANPGGNPIDTGTPEPIIIVNLDTTAPTLSETTPIDEYTNDATPSYTFTSDEAGDITYGGSCSSETTVAVVGENTVTFDELEQGTYDDCTITVEDGSGNTSEVLQISEFTVDTTAPILTVIRDIPTRTSGGLEHEFTRSEVCEFLAEHPLSTL